ncbi:MAG: SAM-dependent chlorinase/fluorinase [Cyanothece sp. SIO1E1]|nr:SAM-dependent chlorinase/fluorinase [Cyanothece sp. SIO1E1]
MPIVTLTSDFGWKDYYLPMIKGTILCKNELIQIVDIAHDIPNYDIVQAAFIFKNCWQSFPKGTIHLISVNDYPEEKDKGFVAIAHEGHFFIGPDNGVFSLIFGAIPQSIFQLDPKPEARFPLAEVYATAIGHLAGGKAIQEIGSPASDLVQRITFTPVQSHSQIRGSVIHVDQFENVILNITKAVFEQVGQGREFSLFFKRHDPITALSQQYQDVEVGEILCLFNSADLLEIAVNMGKASSLFGLKVEDTVQIDFRTKPEKQES